MVKKQKHEINNPIDKFFNRFFLDKEMVKDFLINLVHVDFVKHLDFSTLERINERAIVGYEEDKTKDLLFKVKYKGFDIYLSILLEVQSTNDNTMPIRFLNYMALHYENTYQNLKKNETIIPIIPILFYVGSENWNAKIEFHDLFKFPSKNIKPYVPNFKYIPVIIRNIDKEKLVNANTMIERLLSLSKGEDIDEVKELTKKIVKEFIIPLIDENQRKKYAEHLVAYLEQVVKLKLDEKTIDLFNNLNLKIINPRN